MRGIILLNACAGVDGQAGIVNIGPFVYVDATDGRFNINFLVFAGAILFDVDAASRQREAKSEG
jgi:hypothetical protein